MEHRASPRKGVRQMKSSMGASSLVFRNRDRIRRSGASVFRKVTAVRQMRDERETKKELIKKTLYANDR